MSNKILVIRQRYGGIGAWSRGLIADEEVARSRGDRNQGLVTDERRMRVAAAAQSRRDGEGERKTRVAAA